MKLLIISLCILFVALSKSETTPGPTTAAPDVTTKTTTTKPTKTTSATTTTSVTPPNTQAPPSKPASQSSLFDVVDGTTNITCILLRLAGRFKANYTLTDASTAVYYFDVPKNGSAHGQCFDLDKNNTQYITVTFGKKDVLKELTLVFNRTVKGNTFTYRVHRWNITFDSTKFPGIKSGDAQSKAMREKNDFQVNGANSYSCVTKQSYPFVSRVEMELSHYKAQAFRTITEKDFSTDTPCPADIEGDKIVPIVVGASLAALVIIVLVAYLIGRRRNRTGYETWDCDPDMVTNKTVPIAVGISLLILVMVVLIGYVISRVFVSMPGTNISES